MVNPFFDHTVTKSSASPLFEAAPFFMLRTPIFPFEVFETLLKEEEPGPFLLSFYEKSPLLREAILAASPILYENLGRFAKLNEKAKEQALSSLLKYVLRMSTRATPFGLFAFVSLGHFGQVTKGKIDLSKIEKKGRPDMDWLLKILDQIFDRPDWLSKLPFKTNPLIQYSMGRVILPYSRRKADKQEEVSIRGSSLVMQILFKGQEEVIFEELVDELLIEQPALEKDKVAQMIEKLCREDFLIPTIFPSLLSCSPFEDLVDNLKKILPHSEILTTLLETKQEIDQYNNQIFGQGEDILKNLITKMKEKGESATPLQIDSYSPESVVLDANVGKEIGKIAELLWELSRVKTGIPHLREYHTRFLEKYGDFRLVPLTEVVDQIKGIGFPQSYSSGHSENETINNEERDNCLLEIWLQCLMEKKGEIHLSEEFINRFSSKDKKNFAPFSFDFFCELLADSDEEINRGDYSLLVHPVTGAGDGGSTFGRFAPFFDKDKSEKLAEFLKKEEANHPEILFCETSFFPRASRSGNVAINPLYRSRVLDVGFSKESKQSIQLSDIYVGATHEYLFLSLPKEKKELTVVALNALNPEIAPPVIRLLREISKDRFRFLSPFDWGNGMKLPYRPRVRYQKAILSLASWRVTHELIKAHPKEDLETVALRIKSWGDQWEIPRFIYLTYSDNKILLDRSKISHLKEIAQALKSNSKQGVLLTEHISAKGWIKSPQGHHRVEIVIPFCRSEQPFPSPYLPPCSPIDPKIRFQVPGSEWVYLKLYLPNNESRFLLDAIAPFIETHYQDFEKWFFIRYQENLKPHIRLRFKIKQPEKIGHFLQKLKNWYEPFIHQGWIQDLQFSSYEREVERYGGIDVIDYYESVFNADSECALWMLSQLQTKKVKLPDFGYVAISLVKILFDLEFSLVEQIKLLEKMELDKKNLEGFREVKKEITPLLMSIVSNPSSEAIFPPLAHPLQLEKRKRALTTYYEKLKKLGTAESIEKVVLSLLHMHCNRIMGINQVSESKAYLFALNGLKTIFEMKMSKAFKGE